MLTLFRIILSNYCVNLGDRTGLEAAFTVSVAWNLFESCASLEKPINQLLFNSFLCNGLKKHFTKYAFLFLLVSDYFPF